MAVEPIKLGIEVSLTGLDTTITGLDQLSKKLDEVRTKQVPLRQENIRTSDVLRIVRGEASDTSIMLEKLGQGEELTARETRLLGQEIKDTCAEFERGNQWIEEANLRTIQYEASARALGATLLQQGRAVRRVGIEIFWLGLGSMFLAMSYARVAGRAYILRRNQLTLLTATNSLTDAEERLAEAVGTFGPSSSQAIRASRTLQEAQLRLKIAEDSVRAAAEQQALAWLMLALGVAPTLIRGISSITSLLWEHSVAATTAAAAEGNLAASQALASGQAILHLPIIGAVTISYWKLAFAIGAATAGLSLLAAALTSVYLQAETERQLAEMKETMEDMEYTMVGGSLVRAIDKGTTAFEYFRKELIKTRYESRDTIREIEGLEEALAGHSLVTAAQDASFWIESLTGSVFDFLGSIVGIKIDWSTLIPSIDWSTLFPSIDWSNIFPEIDWNKIIGTLPEIDWDRMTKGIIDWIEDAEKAWDDFASAIGGFKVPPELDALGIKLKEIEIRLNALEREAWDAQMSLWDVSLELAKLPSLPLGYATDILEDTVKDMQEEVDNMRDEIRDLTEEPTVWDWPEPPRWEAMKYYQYGTPYVPGNMLAMLHRGEAVLSAREAERYRLGLGEVRGGNVITLYGPWYIREEADIYKIKRMLQDLNKREYYRHGGREIY